MLEMKDFELTGNVIHTSWFQTITKTNGKADLVAINILAEIVYWYKPRELRDELTGAHLGWKNKYKEDLLQKSYASLADQFGLTERQVKTAIKTLEDLGVIKRVFRDITTNGIKLYNVLYIKLNKDKLEGLSVINEEQRKLNKEKRKLKKRHENKIVKRVVSSSRKGKWTHFKLKKLRTLECNTLHILMTHPLHSNDTPPTLECTTPYIKKETPLHCNVEPPTIECHTNTEITTRITTEISSSSKKDDEEELSIDVQTCVKFWQDNFYMLRGYDLEVMIDLCQSHPTELILEAMKIAKKNNARALIYIERTLIDWKQNGITTLGALQSYLREREEKKNGTSTSNTRRTHEQSSSSKSNASKDESTTAERILRERGCTTEELQARASRDTNF